MDTGRPEWYQDIKLGPLENRPPNVVQIQQIKDSVRYKIATKNRFKAVTWSMILVVSLVIMFTIGLQAYQHTMKEHIQQAATLGSKDYKDLQQAIMEFRRVNSLDIKHIQPIGEDGVLVFYIRHSGNGNDIDLSMEYMRRTIWGRWKWVHGGGFGSSRYANVAVYYHYLKSPDAYIHTRTPFPIVYGVFDNNQVSRIFIQDGQKNEARPVYFPLNENTTGWFAYVPDKIEEFVINGQNKNGQTVESHIVKRDDNQATSTTVPAR